jgi:hypothetical protein
VIETRIEKHISFSEFIATESRSVPFSREQLLEMAIDQVSDGKPLTIFTNRTIFIISPESIAEFLNPSHFPGPEVVAAPETKPVAPVLPGEVTDKSPV